VPHYPLWWEDPFEDHGDRNDTFAWTSIDYVAWPYSMGRYLVNTIAWPVSAIVTLPGTPMVSDGVVVDSDAAGRLYFDVETPLHPHDALRGHSPDPTATNADFIGAGDEPEAAAEQDESCE
jgi:hypothetical protein